MRTFAWAVLVVALAAAAYGFCLLAVIGVEAIAR